MKGKVLRPGRFLLRATVFLFLIVTFLIVSSHSDALSDEARWTWESNINNANLGSYNLGAVGDLNGDNYDDVCVGAAGINTAYVFYGSSTGLASSPDWVATESGAFGFCDGADVNGDGFQDLIVGAFMRNGSNYFGQGAIFVYHGSPAGLLSTPDLLIEGFGSQSRFGTNSNAGDVNGDGYEDVIVGALWDWGYRGKAYVFYGSPEGLDRDNRSDIWNPNFMPGNPRGCTLNWGDDYYASSVNDAGDVNGDGYDDLLVSSVFDKCFMYDEGAVHLYLGSASGIAANALPDLTIRGGQAYARFDSAASAGDVNGDGYDDFTASAPRYDQGGLSDRGRVLLFLGGPIVPDGVADWILLGNQVGDQLQSTIGNGDFNGDGFGDVLVANPRHSGTDRAQIYLGSADGLSSTPAWTAYGEQANSRFGEHAHGIGDIRNAGYDALMIADTTYSNGQTNEGKVYVFYNGVPATYAGGPYNVIEGGSIVLNGSGFDPDGDLLAYAWDLDDDGTFETSGTNPTFSAAERDGPDTQTVVLQVCDDSNECDTDSTTVTIDNVPPTATLVADDPDGEGSSFVLSMADPYDPSSTDTTAGFEYAFDCSDGSGYGGYSTSNSITCMADDDGLRNVKGAIRDKDGGVREYSAEVTIVNLPPTVSVDIPAVNVDEGQLTANSGSYSDVPADVVTLDVDVGFIVDNEDGTWSWNFDATDGPVESTLVTVTASDDDGGNSTMTFDLNVYNVAPTASFANVSGDVLEGGTAVLAFSDPFDPSTADTTYGFLYTYDCTNDGAFESVDVPDTSFDCTYPSAGSFTAMGRIADKDGDFTDYTVAVTVLTPSEAILDLVDMIESFNLQQGIDNSLDAKLDAARNVLADINQNNNVAAINSLQAFVNAVEAQRGGKLTDTQADALVSAAQIILDSIAY